MWIDRRTLSLELTTIFLPEVVSRMYVIQPLVILVEWIVSLVLVETMLAHPLFVPVMMCSPDTVNTATVVRCFASAAARFSSISPSSAPGMVGRFGALEKGCFLGIGSVMSTRYGVSSKRAQTNRLLSYLAYYCKRIEMIILRV